MYSQGGNFIHIDADLTNECSMFAIFLWSESGLLFQKIVGVFLNWNLLWFVSP